MSNKDILATAVYIDVEADVRYWEDATINGQDDKDGTLTPFRFGDTWHPEIRLADGYVMSWPQGMTADIHFKVCDAGEYWLLDEYGARIAKWAGSYVPDAFLCHGGNGYGDYIIFKVGPDGLIQNYRRPPIELATGEDDQSGWRVLDATQEPA